MERLALWWRRNVTGGLHDHEEGEERASCSGCRYEHEVLWPSPPASVPTRVSGPSEQLQHEESDAEREAGRRASARLTERSKAVGSRRR